MIIGGAYQGKLAYAKETFPDVRWTDGEQCEKEAIFQYRGIFHFHKYIERLLSEGEDISELAKQLKEKNPDLILVTRLDMESCRWTHFSEKYGKLQGASVQSWRKMQRV